MNEQAEHPETETTSPENESPQSSSEEEAEEKNTDREETTGSDSSRNRIITSRSREKLDLTDSEYYLNREYSLLEFQKRVLHEAVDETNPLLHRVEFLAHFTRNMNEFYMKRIGGLKQQIAMNVTELTPDGRNPREQWEEAVNRSRDLFQTQFRVYREEIKPALEDHGIHILNYEDLTDKEHKEMRDYFEKSLLPILTPLTLGPGTPFPFISNLSLSLAVLTRRKQEESLRFSRIKIPRNRPRLVRVESSDQTHKFILIEDVIAANLDLLFPYVEIIDHSLFRVTRNAEVRRNEEVAEDLIEMIEDVLRERRFASVVRLEVEEDMHEYALKTLVNELELNEREVFKVEAPIDFTEFDQLTDLDKPEIKNSPWEPQPHSRLESTPGEEGGETGRSIFAEIRKKDLLLHHPYHSFDDTVQTFLDRAAGDPDVLAIKLAIYRTAPDSEVISTIIEAANNGKQVAVMVELKARFDEENNLRWVQRLEEEGIHVAYGTVGFKTHTKTAIVVREEEGETRIYSHVASGNYHSRTADHYVDIGLLTADPDIGHDVARVFNFFTGHSYPEDYRKLLVAPGNMRNRFSEYIQNEAERSEAGEEARIVAKVNRLEDPEIVRELYRASMAGVQIDLIVRDICRLRPQLYQVSENVTVRSIVGRFLEHSRIFYFENGGDPRYLIGSADWMTRNLDNRVEAVAPVEDPDLQEELEFILNTCLRDNQLAWTLNSDGSYEKVQPAADEEPVNSQDVFMKRAVEQVKEDMQESTSSESYPDG